MHPEPRDVPGGGPPPFFSVLVTAYNRQDQIERCIRSCSEQNFDDFEIVVVDDASTDDTLAVLAAIDEPRLRVVRHERNRGISPARATTVSHARGEWLVMLDSDWELLPGSLARLRELIEQLPAGVRIIRSRLRWDSGRVSPSVLPVTPVTDYRGRLEWLEAIAVTGGSSDAAHCIHRAVFDDNNYPTDRRGAIETLWETDLARREPSLWVADILGLQHADAANSASRDRSVARLLPRLLAESADLSWMAESMLSRHGSELARFAPHYYRYMLNSAAREALLSGDRKAGIRQTLAARRAGAGGAQLWATLALGLLDRRVLAYAKLAGRNWRAPRMRRSISR
jgi:glycosyltransferase involved in cell wall biosynthesis